MRKWLWPLAALIWFILIFIPWPGTPPLQNFLLYPNSLLRVELEHTSEVELASSEYPGLEVNFDQRGVPHIFAKSEEELAYGMGFVHAKDRQFQLEMLRRTVKGRLSEVVGWDAVKSDRFWLKFDFEAKSKHAYEILKEKDPEIAGIFAAYAEGFNYYLSQQKPGEKAPEFHLLGFEPTPLEPHDPILLIRYMDKTLNYREDDLKFSALKKYLPDELINYYYPWQTDYVFPIYPELSLSKNQGDSTLTDSLIADSVPLTTEIVYTSSSDFENAEWKKTHESEVGSNNWAVAAERSKTGNAFLCNDPHLGLDLPSTWYEVHQVVNGQACHGFSIPGAPFVISGFTDKVAWGMTNATWNLSEFYKLETNDQGQYKLDGKWEDLEKRYVEFPVKGYGMAHFVYYQSHFGPLDSLEGDYLATQWVAENFDYNELRPFFELKQAENIHAAYRSLLRYAHPPQNFVLADNNGDIGMVTSGLALMHEQPQRGINLGLRRSDKAEYEHLGRRLYVLEPEKGWNHSANQHQVSNNLSPYLNSIFAPSARGRRISQMLSQKRRVDADYMARMQGDVIDGEWPLIKDLVIRTSPELFRSYMRDWNGSCNTQSIAASIYNVFKKAICDSLSAELMGEFDFQPPQEEILYKIANNQPLPLPKGNFIDRDELIQKAWAGTVKYLGDYYGYNPKFWEYGKIHKIYLRHIARLRPFNNMAFAAPGSPRTINVSTGKPGTHGPSMRTLIELGDERPNAKVVLAGGQSGVPGHEHYVDQVKKWRSVEYYDIEWITANAAMEWELSYKFN